MTLAHDNIKMGCRMYGWELDWAVWDLAFLWWVPRLWYSCMWCHIVLCYLPKEYSYTKLQPSHCRRPTFGLNRPQWWAFVIMAWNVWILNSRNLVEALVFVLTMLYFGVSVIFQRNRSSPSSGFQQAEPNWCYRPEDHSFHSHCHENMK